MEWLKMGVPRCKEARSLLSLGDPNGALRIVESEISRLGDRGDARDLWELRFIRADVLSLRGRVEEALAYLDSFTAADAGDLKSRAFLRMHRGALLGSLGRYEPSHRLLSEAEAMASEAGLLDLLGEAYLRHAFVFFLQKNYSSSDQLFRAVLELSEKLAGWYFRGHALWGVGKNLMIQEHHGEAMPWLEESLGMFETAGARLDIAMVWSELAVCWLGLGDDEKAMELFRKAEKVNQEAGYIHNYQVVLANIGNVYLHRRDHLTAISYYRRALTLAREIKDPVSIKKWSYNINLVYARIRLSVDQRNPRIA